MDHGKALEAIELAWYGAAYAQNAHRLCECMVEHELHSSLYDYRVVVHLAHLALELLFKAGLAATFQEYPRSHNLGELEPLYQAQFSESVPIRVPQYIRSLGAQPNPKQLQMFPSLLGEIVGKQPNELERFKYPVDRKGNPFPPVDIADLDQLLKDLTDLSNDATRLQVHIWKIVELNTGRRYIP